MARARLPNEKLVPLLVKALAVQRSQAAAVGAERHGSMKSITLLRRPCQLAMADPS